MSLEVIPSQVVIADVKESLKQAVEKMNAHRVGSILIYEGKVLKGIFTERDLLRHVSKLLDDPTIFESPITQFMSTPVRSILAKDLHHASDIMIAEKIRHLPVIGNDKDQNILGMLSIRDLFALLNGLSKRPPVKLALKFQTMGVVSFDLDLVEALKVCLSDNLKIKIFSDITDPDIHSVDIVCIDLDTYDSAQWFEHIKPLTDHIKLFILSYQPDFYSDEVQEKLKKVTGKPHIWLYEKPIALLDLIERMKAQES